MHIPKTIVSRILLLAEIALFISYCLFSSSGLPEYLKLQKVANNIIREIQETEKAISQLESDITIWNIDPFYKEKKIREQLQMAKSDEEIIFIKTIKGTSL